MPVNSPIWIGCAAAALLAATGNPVIVTTPDPLARLDQAITAEKVTMFPVWLQRGVPVSDCVGGPEVAVTSAGEKFVVVRS